MKRILQAAIVCLFVASCRTGEEPQLPAPEPEADVVDSVYAFPGEMIVQFSEELTAAIEKDLQAGEFLQTKSDGLNSLLASIGASSVERLYRDAGEWEPRHREAGLHTWYRVKFDPELPQTRAVREIGDIPGIVYAGVEPRIKSNAVFNDPMLGRQWHYINNGKGGSQHKAGCDINVEPVWRNFTGGRKDVIVAVIDGGIDYEHEDLGAVVIPGGPNGSQNFVDGSYKIEPHTHGTHVAGTIGAINNNGIGVCGIAGGLDGKGGVQLLSCQVFKNNPDDPEHDLSGGFYEALVWAADQGAVIANNSWGNVFESEEKALQGSVGGMKGAIDYFIKYAGTDKNGNQTGPMKGGLVLFSSGNEGWKIGWPAAYDKVIAVGAVAPDFTRASYSNYGDWVDLAAPGGSYLYDNGEILSTVVGNKYDTYQGTSMACPHASGVAALIVSQFGGPGFTADMLKERLLGGANKNVIPRNAQIGPLADAFGSFSYGSTEPPAKVASHEISAKSNFLTFKWKAVKDPDDKIAYGYMILASKDRTLLDNPNYGNLPDGVVSAVVSGSDYSVGEEITGILEVSEFSADYFTSVVAYDFSMNYSQPSASKVVKTGVNNPPVISTDFSGKLVLKAFENQYVDFHFSDPDGHTFTVAFDPGSSAVESVDIMDTYRVTVTGKDADAGKYEAKISLTDKYGASTSFTLPYEILENHAPEAKGNIDNLIFEAIAKKMSLNMEDYISDPDGEQLSYTYESTPPAIIHLNQVDDVLNLTTLSYGLAFVTITATDIKGLTASVELKVLVRDPASEPDIYPSQVTDYLSISDGEDKELSVTICNSSGVVVYETKAVCDAFNPIMVDMRSWAPARYSVSVVSAEGSVKRTVVKL